MTAYPPPAARRPPSLAPRFLRLQSPSHLHPLQSTWFPACDVALSLLPAISPGSLLPLASRRTALGGAVLGLVIFANEGVANAAGFPLATDVPLAVARGAADGALRPLGLVPRIHRLHGRGRIDPGVGRVESGLLRRFFVFVGRGGVGEARHGCAAADGWLVL